jgi:phasin family protein
MAQQFELPKADELLAPFKALNELALSNAEKLVSMQSKNFEKYSKIALSSLQEAAQVSDLEQSQAYFTKQGEVSKKVAEDMAADMKEVAELGQAYAAEVQKLMSESVSKATEKAA